MCADLLAGMKEIGCTADEIATAKRLYESARYDELRRHLRLCRCELIDRLHEQQKNVDRLDFLIRRTEKIQKGASQ